MKPTVAWVLLNLSRAVPGDQSMTDFDFRQIVGKPDNVPIVGMLFIVGYFTWLYFAEGGGERPAAAGKTPRWRTSKSRQRKSARVAGPGLHRD